MFRDSLIIFLFIYKYLDISKTTIVSSFFLKKNQKKLSEATEGVVSTHWGYGKTKAGYIKRG